MATTTTNYELTKAGYNDIPDIKTINDNMDTLDSSLVVGESNDDVMETITKTTGWTNAEPVTLGDKFQSAMTKISTMIKNLKWIYKFIGSTDISSIGDGTITNAISTLSSNKLNASDVKTSLTDTSTAHALSTASGKALNDALTPLYKYYMTNCNAVSVRCSINNGGVKKIGSAVVVNLIFKAVTTASNSPQIMTSPYKPRYDSALSCIDITNGISSAIESDIPCGIASNGTIYVKTLTTNHIYALTGVFITADYEID